MKCAVPEPIGRASDCHRQEKVAADDPVAAASTKIVVQVSMCGAAARSEKTILRQMFIRLGYDIEFEVPAPVAIVSMLSVHPSRALDLRAG